MANSGKLFVVATPIGNLQDISARALSCLREVNAIAAEDTRHSAKLLQHYAITTPLFSLHEHNEQQRAAELIKRLQHGENIALISDAGTPLLSDPGAKLVALILENHLPVVPIPGPSAITTALSIAGLTASQFVFEGFLPAKKSQRVKRLQELLTETRTLVFFEAPHRIVETIEDLTEIFGTTRQAVITRELTKLFETIRAANLGDLLQWLNKDPQQQLGEFVIVVAGAEISMSEEDTLAAEKILKILLAELPTKQAVQLTEKITGVRKNLLYKLSLQQGTED